MPETITSDQESKNLPKYTDSMQEILALIKGRAPIIWVLTHEETRFIEDFTEQIAEPCKREVWLWSAYQGLVKSQQQMVISRATGEEKETWNPQKALGRIASMNKSENMKGFVYIMRDFHTVLGEPIPRQIRDMYDHLIANGKTLLITSPLLAHGPGGTKSGLPPTLEKQLSVVSYELPTGPIIKERVREVITHMKEVTKDKNKKTKLEYSEDQIHSFSRALQGLTMSEVDTALSTSITHLNRLDVEKLINDKRQIIRKSEILEFIDTPVGVSDVGGLGLAKDYLSKYAEAYTDEAKEFGVEPLKGVLLTGIPGTGKSLLAKATGKLWEVPLLRLDVGKVMSGLVGASEGKMRQVINQAEAMAPCVTGDTVINTISHGNMAIKDLHKFITSGTPEKVKINTYDNANNCYVEAEINTVIRREAYSKNLIKIISESGKTITVTENHKILIEDKGNFVWKEAKDLTTEDALVEEKKSVQRTQMKIKSIKKAQNEKWVYDPVCTGPHTYFGNGILNHNCILWIDEVEKSLSGTKSSNFSDGGTLSRVFGTLLTAMQDGMDEVTIVATANDITALPPEFIRRFNEVFFVDLPGPEERWEIFSIHLAKRGRNVNKFKKNKKQLLAASDNYTGAEIEKAIKDAIAAAFYDGKKDLNPNHLVSALEETKPIFKVMGEKIRKIKEKARGSFRFASVYAENESKKRGVTTKKGKSLDVGKALDDLSEIKTSKKTSKNNKLQASNRFAEAVDE